MKSCNAFGSTRTSSSLSINTIKLLSATSPFDPIPLLLLSSSSTRNTECDIIFKHKNHYFSTRFHVQYRTYFFSLLPTHTKKKSTLKKLINGFCFFFGFCLRFSFSNTLFPIKSTLASYFFTIWSFSHPILSTHAVEHQFSFELRHLIETRSDANCAVVHSSYCLFFSLKC